MTERGVPHFINGEAADLSSLPVRRGHGIHQDGSLVAHQSFHQGESAAIKAIELDVLVVNLILKHGHELPTHPIIAQQRISQAEDQGCRLGRGRALQTAPSLNPSPFLHWITG
jgi:hypothetical protein